MKTALVVLSGGQDSVTCLGIAMSEGYHIHCISFEYGQKHAVELECARKVCDEFGASLRIVDLSFLAQLVTSALTSDGDVNQPHEYKTDLPASFVPNRNALFLTVAHAYAQEVGADVIYTGVCQTDYSGYPDCREQFIKALQFTLNLGAEASIEIKTPLMYKTKAETFALAQVCGMLEVVIEDTHTCYNGDREHRHPWGYGCGECGACKLRAKGWGEFTNAD